MKLMLATHYHDLVNHVTIDFTPEYVRQMLDRIGLYQDVAPQDDQLSELVFRDWQPDYNGAADMEIDLDDDGEEQLPGVPIYPPPCRILPDIFEAQSLGEDTKLEISEIRIVQDEVWYRAYIKHYDQAVETEPLPWSFVEALAAGLTQPHRPLDEE